MGPARPFREERDAPGTPEAVLRRWLDEVWSRGDLDVVDELVAPRYVRHDRRGTRVFTPAGYKAELTHHLRAIESAETTIDDLVATGERVWARVTSRGVNLDRESPVTITWLQVHHVEDGRLTESWVLYETDLDWG